MMEALLHMQQKIENKDTAASEHKAMCISSESPGSSDKSMFRKGLF